MVKANQPDTVNLAGGQAHAQNPELELVSLLLTSFVSDSFYEKDAAARARLERLINAVDPLFAARAAVYARREFGMRSVSHLAASMIAKRIGGKDWGFRFFDAVINRVDDMLEIGALTLANGGKLPNAMKRGFSAAIGRFDNYQLAKYRGEGKAFKLVDLVNLIHPVPNEKNQDALSQLIAGTLKSEGTWEASLSAAGQVEGGADDKVAAKNKAWSELVGTGKISYFALLRNIRNIINQSPESVAAACALLVDAGRIKKSLVLPFRFMQAYDEIAAMPQDKNTRKVIEAISAAMDISCNNVPGIEGETLVVLDVSSSMGCVEERKTPAGIGALFTAVMLKAWKCDLLTFDSTARYVQYNPTNSTLGIMENFSFPGGGTNFPSIFQTANKPYDRVIILSDMQAWVGWAGNQTPANALREYKRKYGANPFVYSFDLKSYGTMQFPESRVAALAGFSDKIFDLMKLCEQDPKALISKINSVEL